MNSLELQHKTWFRVSDDMMLSNKSLYINRPEGLSV